MTGTLAKYNKFLYPAIVFAFSRVAMWIGADIHFGEDQAQSLVEGLAPIIMLIAVVASPKNKA